MKEGSLPWLYQHRAALRRKEIEAVAALGRIRGAQEFVEMLIAALEEGAGEQPAKEGEAADGHASDQ